jgi:hypothetical protein
MKLVAAAHRGLVIVHQRAGTTPAIVAYHRYVELRPTAIATSEDRSDRGGAR